MYGGKSNEYKEAHDKLSSRGGFSLARKSAFSKVCELYGKELKSEWKIDDSAWLPEYYDRGTVAFIRKVNMEEFILWRGNS